MDCKISPEFDKDKMKMDEYCIDMEDMPLAMSYVPWQEWRNVMEADIGLEEGTIFADLVLPFYGRKAVRDRNIECHPQQGFDAHYEKSMHRREMERPGYMRNRSCSNMSGECENMRGRRCNRV